MGTVKLPTTKGRPPEAIRIYWENGGKWPSKEDTVALLARRQHEERSA